jgi:hypothetical protein
MGGGRIECLGDETFPLTGDNITFQHLDCPSAEIYFQLLLVVLIF